MSTDTRNYAALSDDSYKDRSEEQRKNKPFTVNGIEYKIVDTYSNSLTGYYGAAYQRLDANHLPTGEIIIAHRGTSSIRDGVVDAGMALADINAQARDADTFTQRVMAQAGQWSASNNHHSINLTVTGHSLGGTLAEITAYRFNLRGETFNAYGAAGLRQGVPVGGSKVIDHVRATDVVSAASPHFGQVRVYATEQDIQALHAGRYLQQNGQQPNPLLTAVADALPAHGIDNFYSPQSTDSIITPENQARAQAYAAPTERFRQDVERDRIDLATVVRQDLFSPAFDMKRSLNSQDLFSLSQDPSWNSQPPIYKLGGQVLEAGATLGEQAVQQFGDHAGKRILDGTLGLSNALNNALGQGGVKSHNGNTHNPHLPAATFPATPPVAPYGAPGRARSDAHRADGFPLDHRDRAMFDAFRDYVPADIPDETIALIVMQAKQGGVHRYEDIGSMKIYKGNLLVVEGKIPEFSSLTRFNEVAPPMEQTLAKIDILNEQRDRVVQQNALLREHELAQARSYGGPSR